ncbi:hypothetical protein KC357_g174 [Hortaea werneckii]|nr:hypothetical protein KC357_g174 [Hortaea werneckii]
MSIELLSSPLSVFRVCKGDKAITLALLALFVDHGGSMLDGERLGEEFPAKPPFESLCFFTAGAISWYFRTGDVAEATALAGSAPPPAFARTLVYACNHPCEHRVSLT